MKKLLYIMILISISLIPLISCSYNPVDNHEEPTITEETEISKNDEKIIDDSDSSAVSVDSLNTKAICERIKTIDFSVKEFPINYEIYDLETDEIYKTAFYNVISNKEPLKWWNKEDGDDSFLFIEMFRGKWQDNEEFMRFIKMSSQYNYFDFDGDGFPELAISDGNGLKILKYSPEEKRVYCYLEFYDYWHMLGSGQVYCYIPTSANRVYYSYLTYDKRGVVDDEIVFDSISVGNGTGWDKEYFVSINKSDLVKIDKEKWDEITEDFFIAIDNALTVMSFEEVFGKTSY